MAYYFLLAGIVLGIGINILIIRKYPVKIEKYFKFLAVLLFAVYAVRLFSEDVFNDTFNLLYVDVTTPIDAASTWVLPRTTSIILVFLRWATLLAITWGLTSPFFEQRFLKFFMATFGLVVGIMNIVFLRENIIAFIGTENFLSYRSIQFIIEIIVFMTLAVMNLFMIIKEKLRPGWRDLLNVSVITAISSFAVMPLTTLYNLLGEYGAITDDFNKEHIAFLIFPFVIMLVSYFVMFNKRQKDRNLMLIFLVLAAYIEYFFERRYGLGGLPLHLCNMAIILMLLSFIFHLKGVFYFNYFANVLGALVAIVLPSVGTEDVYSIVSMHYWYNHWYAFFIPVLGVAFHTFERPTLKLMVRAIGVFTVYYIVVVFLNAWFNNYTWTDYFFTYGDNISGRFNVEKLQFDNVLSFTWNGLTFKFFWLYQILLYLGFIFLMFASWYVYDAIFQFFDAYYALILKKKKMKMDVLNLRKLLNGKSIHDPIDPGGVNMLKISHFTKQYGNSKKKAVDDFSLEVNDGEVFGFVGHNGAGKSTTIKSLVGIQSITEGEMEICGYSIKTQPLEAKRNIGYVSDNHAVYEKLTGREYIHYVADLYKVPADLREERMESYLDKFNLAFAIDNEIKSYSHGMKQKLVVIASLIHDPKVWILDEPLTGLDPTSSIQIKETMREHANRGNIVFFSSHVIEVVERICDRIAIIAHGKLVGVYVVKDFVSKGMSLEKLYLESMAKKPDINPEVKVNVK